MRGTILSVIESICLLITTPDGTLHSRIENNHIRDEKTRAVTKVNRLEPLLLRKEWMNELAQAVAFLESLNLGHGDLRPENILLDRDRLKLSDFDCAAEFGTHFEACVAPYGRLLNGNESHLGPRGSAGFLGPRTEQFALGSLYYLINYGFEVYGDRCLTEDPHEHGPKTLDLLQNMEFPKLDGDLSIDEVIHKCWHNQYATVAELAAYTEKLLKLSTTGANANEEVATEKIEPVNNREPSDGSGGMVGHDQPTEDFVSKKSFCQDLEKRGLLQLLCSDEPNELGFSFEWYRHSS